MDQKKILIVGGGFGGIAAALKLETLIHARDLNAKITLVSDKPHLEYHSALYRVVTGNSPLEVCIPLREIFAKKNVELIMDKIESVDPENNTATGLSESHYKFDYLILAPGSQTDYFNIPGLEKFSYGFKSITEALKLKNHIHELFEKCKNSDPENKVCLLHFVIIGGGPSGVELAGSLAEYTKKLAREHKVDNSLISIDLIEASLRILPTFKECVSKKAEARLKSLGVKIFTNRPISKENKEGIEARDLNTKTETVVWTAGTKLNDLYQKINGLEYDNKGRVLVDEYLLAKNTKNVFIAGDGASTEYSGMAQTAIDHGEIIAQNIFRLITAKELKKYNPKAPYYSIPIGSGWALTILNNIVLTGYLGWILRRAADFRYFNSILPLRDAMSVFRSGKKLCETCQICGTE